MFNGGDVLKFKIFREFPNVVQGISTKKFGSIRNQNIETENLKKFLKVLDVNNGQTVFMNQIHGNKVVIINGTDKQIIDRTDGLVTNKKNIFLCVTTADCLPIVFYDPFLKIVGAVHAGYKGILNGILDSLIYKIRELNGNIDKVLVGIGPGIEIDCYDVDFKRFNLFKNKFDKFKNIYKLKKGKYFIDLKKIAYKILIQNNIKKENIEMSTICTKCDSRFFSNRNGDKNSRFITIIGMI